MAGPYGLMDQPAEVQGAELAPELTRYAVYLLRRVVSRFGSDTTARSTAAREFVVLSELAGTEGLSQQDLGERLDINRTVMVRLIDKLEHDGVVSRERNPRNRRSYILALTEPGRAALTRMREAIADFDRVHDGSLLPAELDRLKELLVALHPESGSAAGIFSTEYVISQLFYALRRRGDGQLAEIGLRLRHFGPLLTVEKFAPCAQQRLARYLAMTDPATATIVEELVQAGLVLRGQDPGDRRRYALELTPLGRSRLTEMRVVFDRMESEIVETVGPDGEVQLRRLLGKLLPVAGPAAPDLLSPREPSPA